MKTRSDSAPGSVRGEAARESAGTPAQVAHRRRSIRLRDHDYTQPGAYFLTICAHNRACVFGEVVDSTMQLNDAGSAVRDEWFKAAVLRPYVRLTPEEFVVMPNHVHGIIWIEAPAGDDVGLPNAGHDVGPQHVGAQRAAPLPPPMPRQAPRVAPRCIGAIVRAFKSAVTRRINQDRMTPGAPLWQRNYYEHVVRNDHALEHIREYIAANPTRWAEDALNPRNGAR